MDLDKKLNELEELISDIHSYFNYEGYDEPIEYFPDLEWERLEDSVTWYEDDEEYSEDVRGYYEGEDYTMCLVDYCTGNTGLIIFKNENEIK